jgi:hypothetical protein
MTLFLILGPLTTNGQYPITFFTSPVFIIWLWWISRIVNKRVGKEHAAGTVELIQANLAT